MRARREHAERLNLHMPDVTPALVFAIFTAGIVSGALGALIGIGGGVFLVPFLNIGLGFPYAAAAAISLTTLIGMSTSVSAAGATKQMINLRLGMLLEVATAAGGLFGGVTVLSQRVSAATLQRLFAAVVAFIAFTTVIRLNRRNVILDPHADPGLLGGRFHEDESGGVVSYRVKRLPVGLLASFAAGYLSSLLGIGGGVIKVPVLNAWCGVPVRAAAATSAFMIGVTATAGAVIYYGHGQLLPPLAAAAVLGVQIGSWGGIRFGARAPAKWLKILMAAVLALLAIMMLSRTL